MKTNRPSSKTKVFPYFLDLVEDNVRNRCLFPLVALALYVLLVITIIATEDSIPQPPSQIKTRLPFQDSYVINTFFNQTFPTPRILITNNDGSLSNQTVTMQITDLLTAVDGDYPICDATNRKAMAGTLEFIRYEEVCRIQIWNRTSISDHNGQSQYDGLKFARAPQGSYYFNFFDDGKNAQSEEYTTFLQTTVIKMKIVSGDPPLYQELGIPFTTQPLVQVLDQNGYPVSGKNVVAFSWPEPQFSGTVNPYLIGSGKFAWLEGDVSESSNATGFASFKNLTIKGSNSQYVYLYFVCDGIITQFWGRQDPKFAPLLNINIYYRYAIHLNTTVSNLSFVQNYSTIVIEGQPFNKTPMIRVLDDKGNPVKNKIVFASLIMANGDILPYKYQRNDGGFNKALVKPIPGTYNENYTDPFLQEDILIPFYTNDSGIIEFKELFFSIYGPTGQYKIQFDCDGVALQSDIIYVVATVANIKIMVQPSSYITSDAGDIETQINCMIQVVDATDNPIQGKTPNIKMLKPNGDEYGRVNLDLKFDVENSLYNPSDENGYIRLFFDFSYASASLTNITMSIEIDTIKVKTNSFLLEYKNGDKSICGGIDILNFPSETYVGEIINPSPSFKVYNTLGQVLAQAQVLLDSTFNSDEVTEFPSGIFPDLRQIGTQTTDGAGIATFDNFVINQGVYSHIYIQAITYTANNPEYQSLIYEVLQNLIYYTSDELDQLNDYLDDLISSNLITKCKSNYIRILVKPVLAKITISNYQLTSKMYNELTINLGTNQTISLNLFDPQNQIIKSRDFEVSLQFIQIPGYMTYTKFFDDEEHAPIKIYDNIEINANGTMNLKLFVGSGFPGKYAVNFKCSGVYSDAFLFSTNFNFKEVQIASNFSSTYEESVGTPVGIYLNQGFVRVIDVNGLSLPYVPVYAKIITSVNSSKAFIDYSEAGDDGDSSIVISWHRIAYTAVNGLANFKKLTLIEVTESTCVQFEFYVGDTDQFVKSTPTQMFCFKSDSSYEIYSDLYSKTISMNNPMIKPLQIKASNNKFPDLLMSGLSVIIAIPYYINDKALNKPLEMAPLYMKNFACIYNMGYAIKSCSKFCTQYIDVKGSKPYFYLVEFKGLKWIQSAFSTSFYLSISNLFNYIRPDTSNPSVSITPNGAKASSKIEVSNTPDIIQITSQPPSLIYVGDIFEVSVTCKVSSGSPIVRGVVKAAVVQISTKAESNVNTTLYKIKSIIYGFSEGNVDIDSLASNTKKSSNVILDPSTYYAKTDRKGIANFNLRVQTGLSGEYNIIFSAQNIQSSPSTTFQLLNRISTVNFAKNIETNAIIDVTISDNFYTFTDQPKINITYLDNVVDVRNKTIEVLIYKALDQDTINSYQSQLNNSINSTRTNMETLLQQKLSNTENIDMSFSSISSSLLNAVVNGGKLKRSVERVAMNFPIQYDYPTQDSQGNLIFKNLKVNFNDVGSYNLIIVINGVESEISNTIVISQPEVTFEEYVISLLQKLLVVLMSIFVIMANSAYHNYCIWMPLGFGSCIVLLILMNQIAAPAIWKALIFIITGIILVFMIEVLIQIINFIRKGKKYAKMTFNVREEMFYEYTYQTLFKRPSNNWVSQDYQNPYELLQNKSKINERNFDKSPQTKLIKDSPDFENKKNKIFELGLISAQDDAQDYEKICETKYENLKFAQKIKRLLTPFSFFYSQKWVIADCFFFPQRIITSGLLGACSVAYFAYLFFSSLQDIFKKFGDLGSQIHNSFLIFMGGALSSFKSSFSGTSFDEDQFQKGMNFVMFISDHFSLLARCLSIGFYIGSSISLFCFILLAVWNFHNFKKIALDMRRGNFFFPKPDLSITNSTPFIGMQIAVSAVSFLIVSTVIGIVFTIIVHPLLWQYLWENIVLILIAVGLNIANAIVKMTVLKYLLDPFKGVKHRRLFAIYEIFAVYLEIIGGLLTALNRIITQMIFGLITLLRVDESILPFWILKRTNLDSVNAGFYSAIYMYHTHNHPIFITFANILMVIWEEQAKMKKEGTQESYLKKRRLANKLRVCYYLVKYPNLLKERKKRKEKEVEKEEEEAKEEKEKIKENLNLPSKKAKKLKEITYEPNKEKKVEIEMSELDKN